MLSPEGNLNPHFGRYREITPHSRLVFTWNSEWTNGETVVTINFKDLGDSTELVLRHEGFSGEEGRDGHQIGWTAILEHMLAVYRHFS